MQFSIIALILSATVAVSAAPAPVTNTENLGPNVLSKRTCGTLTGLKLKICRDACKATCTAATLGVGLVACKKACDAGPLKARDAEDDEEEEEVEQVDVIATEDAELDTRGLGKKVCDAACDVTCNSTVLALEQLKCLKDCKAKC